MIRFIAEHKDHREPGPHGAGLRWGVEPMCAVLSEHGIVISPSTFYQWVDRQPSRRQLADAQLVQIIRDQREDKDTGNSREDALARKLAEAERTIGQLALENDLLGKASRRLT